MSTFRCHNSSSNGVDPGKLGEGRPCQSQTAVLVRHRIGCALPLLTAAIGAAASSACGMQR